MMLETPGSNAGGTPIFGHIPLCKDSAMVLILDMADDFRAHKIDKFRLKIHGSIFTILWVYSLSVDASNVFVQYVVFNQSGCVPIMSHFII